MLLKEGQSRSLGEFGSIGRERHELVQSWMQTYCV